MILVPHQITELRVIDKDVCIPSYAQWAVPCPAQEYLRIIFVEEAWKGS